MYGSFKYHLEVIDPNNRKTFTSGLKVQVYSAGRTTATIYADKSNTSKTNPISITTFDALGDGVIEFWCTDANINVGVFDKFGNSQLFRNVTPTTHSLMFLQNGADKALSVEFFEDFTDGYVSGDRWTLATDTGGTMTIDDATDGIGALLTGATNNDGSTLGTTDEIFLAQTDKNGYFEARVKCTEANTDDANIFVGLADIVTVDLMQDDGAGPAATLDGIGFYKLDGNMYWEFQASNATTEDDNSDMVAFASNTWYTLAFFYDYGDGTTASITPYVNGIAYDPVTLTISGMAEMHVALSAKAGAANAETLKVDYIRFVQDRDE